MKALALRQPRAVEDNPLEAVDMPMPVHGPDDILIRVHACGVCHTDLHIVEGEIPPHVQPVVPGHQIVGRVHSRGPRVSRFEVGDRVGVPWLFWACGHCTFCLRDQENLCQSARFTGYDTDGGYAEYAVAPADFAYRLPEGLSDFELAPLLCAGVIGYRALRLSQAQPGDTIGLFGFGASAHIVIQIARHWDCRVYVFTRGAEHKRLARELGAAWVGDAWDEPPDKIQCGIVFAPAGWIVLAALRALEKGGTLALAGIYMSPIPEIDYRWLYHERTIRSVANSTREDVRQLLQLAGEIPIRTETEIFPFTSANEALKRLKQSDIKGAGVLNILQQTAAETH